MELLAARRPATPNPQSGPIVPTLERVLARDPNHPGAIHYYIHAVEASDRPERAEPYADRLRGAIPGAGHLVHMPSHIYYRVGRYLDALADNKTAAEVDEKYLAATNAPMGVYRLGYYPHNVHFVLASAQMAGDGPTVIAAAEKLRGLIPDEVARVIALVQPVKAAPYFAHALFSPSATVLALPDPGDAIPYVKAMWHYARGVASAAQGDFSAAKAEANAIAALEGGDFTLLNASGVPAKDVLALARTVIEARVAQRQGDKAAAIERFERAAALQDGLPYMEPPYWYYPVRQSLAVALMQAGPTRRRGGAVQARAEARPGQRLVVVRACRTLQGARQGRRGEQARSRSCQDVDRRPTAAGPVEAVTLSTRGAGRRRARKSTARGPRWPRAVRHPLP